MGEEVLDNAPMLRKKSFQDGSQPVLNSEHRLESSLGVCRETIAPLEGGFFYL